MVSTMATTFTIHHGDCLDYLRTLADGSVDAVVTDPPYGIGADAAQAERGNMKHGAAICASKYYGHSDWDRSRPSRELFTEVMRVASVHVIFGGNYFADIIPPSASWIVWDKDNGTNDYADFELAWTSHKRASRKVRWRWHGMLQEHGGGNKDARCHPTQKPVGLMRWVLENYCDAGCTVLDPFMGSGTTGVACMETGRNFIGCEIDATYCEITRKRIKAAQDQGRLFT